MIGDGTLLERELRRGLSDAVRCRNLVATRNNPHTKLVAALHNSVLVF